MPELPEVETVRRGLAPVMEGRRILGARNNRPDLRFPFPEKFAERLTGTVIDHLERRAKYLLAHLSSGETLLMHLGMSGRFTIEAPNEAARDMAAFVYAPGGNPKHDHAVFDMEGGARVIFNDPRRFGFMALFATNAMADQSFLSGLGPEPLGNEFSPAHLDAALAGKKSPIKMALLDQRIVAGLGNIYVCEALWRAGISPRRMASSIPGKRSARLVPHIRDVLSEAIEAGGTTLRDFAATDGALGYFQHSFAVYGRENEICRADASHGPVQRIVQSGRSTFFCPSCQR